LLLCLTVLVHAYLFVMLAAIWGTDMVQRLWRRETSWTGLVVHAGATTMLVIVLMWLVGYFIPVSTTQSSILGHLDLSFPFWAGFALHPGWSWFLPTKAIGYKAGNGFGYFGLGFMLLCVIAVVTLLGKRFGNDRPAGKPVRTSTFIALFLGCGILF